MAQDYSFDVVSQFDRQELVNAVNQAQREIVTRYDFKDTGASIDLGEDELTRSLVKQIKQISPKVQPRIQGDTIRVSSREKDLLQQVITALKASETKVPLQFINYR